MAEMRGAAGFNTFRMAKVGTGQVLLHPDPDWGLRVHCDFEPETSEARLVIFDGESNIEIYSGVRQMTPILREVLAAFEARLAELPE